MASPQTILLQASAKNSVISYYCPLLMAVPVIITGTGIEDMVSIDDVESAVMEVGTDGTLSAHVKPAMVKFKLMLQPLSSALNAMIAVQQTQYQSGVIFPGAFITSNPSGLWEVSYQNVIITSYFKGFELAEKVKDVPVSFAAQIPTTTIIGDLVSIAAAITGVI